MILFLKFPYRSGIFVEQDLRTGTQSATETQQAQRSISALSKTHRPVRVPEPQHPPPRLLELVGRQLHLVDFHDGVPQRRVLGLQDDDEAGALGVEGAGDVLDGVGDELLDAGVGDGGLVGELVDGTAGFGGVEEGLRVGRGG